MSSEFYQILYLSKLSPYSTPACVTDIIRQSRANNREHEITGILIFDGNRFCQYLEGPKTSVCGVMSRIFDDQRHYDIRMLQEGETFRKRRFADWTMAYGLIEKDLEAVFDKTGDNQHIYNFDNMLIDVEMLADLDREPGI